MHTEQNNDIQSPVENVLNGYYKNAAVGADSISCLLGAVQDFSFRKELFQQRDYYEQQKKDLTAQMASLYQIPKKQGTLAKFYTRMTIQMHKRNGIDVHEAAKLMVQGTNMGMIQLHEVLNHNADIPDTLRQQGDRILAHERDYLDRMTPYL